MHLSYKVGPKKTEFDEEIVVTNVEFNYYDFDLEDKIDFAIETGMIFEDYDVDYSDDEE